MSVASIVERLSLVLLRLAPASFREAWQCEIVGTVTDACLEARATRGLSGLITTGAAELSDLGRMAMAARLGKRAAITGARRTTGVSGIQAGPSGSSDPSGSQRSRPFRPGALSHLARDLRLAFRSLSAAKLPVAIAIVTLALGIGVNSAVFSIIDSTMLRPMPFANADRLDEIWNLEVSQGFSYPGFGRPLLLEWRKQTDLFDRVEGYDITSFVLDRQEGAEMVTGAYVTPGLLAMLNVAPAMGRLFQDGDGRGGTETRLIVSQAFWRETLDGDPDAIGRKVSFNGKPHDVIGVMPASFQFPNDRAVFWVPFDIDAPPPGQVQPRLVAFVRRATGAAVSVVAAEVERRGVEVSKAAGGTGSLSARLRSSGFGRLDVRLERSLWVLGGAVSFLLLIVCANLANLSLSRVLARSRDFAVRSALGASRRDLVREALVEQLVVGFCGAVAGLLIAAAMLNVTVSLLPEGALLSSMNAIDLDARALAFTAAIGIITAVLFGLPPALVASRPSVGDVLKNAARGSTGSRASRRLRSSLVVAEVTLAIVLLVGAALMARSFMKLQRVDRGFDSTGLVMVRVGLPAAGYLDPYARDRFTELMLERLRSVEGVTGATAGYVPPDSSMISFGKIEVDHRPGERTPELVLPVYQVWSNYFDLVGIPLRSGRAFGPDEPRESAIVSESFARQHWPTGNAVGGRFRIDNGMWRTIVGVAGEVRQLDLDDSSGSFEFYYPLRRPAGLPSAAPTGPISAIVDYRSFAARTDGGDLVADRLRRVVHEIDPKVVVWRVDSVEQNYADAVARPRLVLLLLAVFASMGLVLAAAGIYGVLSYTVTQRRREIGIRFALGARPRTIGRLILGNGLTLTGIGLALGLVLSLGLVRVMRTLLYEVEPTDPVSVGVVSVVLLGVAALAAWRPSRQAMRVDPVTLLREQ